MLRDPYVQEESNARRMLVDEATALCSRYQIEDAFILALIEKSDRLIANHLALPSFSPEAREISRREADLRHAASTAAYGSQERLIAERDLAFLSLAAALCGVHDLEVEDIKCAMRDIDHMTPVRRTRHAPAQAA